MVLIAIPTIGDGGLSKKFSDTFGRCDSFTFVTVENNEIIEVRTIENPAKIEDGGAGVKATQFVGNNNANGVIVGYIGPNASQSLNKLAITMYKAPNEDLSVNEVLDLYLKGKLDTITSSNMPNASSTGTGRGMGMGKRRRRQL